MIYMKCEFKMIFGRISYIAQILWGTYLKENLFKIHKESKKLKEYDWIKMAFA